MTILYILAGIILLILILGIIAPKNYDVYREITIDKPNKEVFNYLKSLNNQAHWSPWEEKDPNMHKEFRGTDGEVGSVSAWKGNKDVGEGEQEITKIIDGERIEGQLRFFKPWKSEADCYFNTTSKGKDSTVVRWGFSGKNKFPFSIFMLFMNMDKAVGGDFEKGLAKLKTILEK